MNFIYDIIQDSIIENLEKDVSHLPEEFEISIPDDAFIALSRDLVYSGTKEKLSSKVKRVTLNICGREVLVRSDIDPEPWLPITWKDALQ